MMITRSRKNLLKLDGVSDFLQSGGKQPFFEIPYDTLMSILMEFGPEIPIEIFLGPSSDETDYLFCLLDDLKKSENTPIITPHYEEEEEQPATVEVEKVIPVETPVISAPTIEPKRRGRGRPCKCAERGIDCQHNKVTTSVAAH